VPYLGVFRERERASLSDFLLAAPFLFPRLAQQTVRVGIIVLVPIADVAVDEALEERLFIDRTTLKVVKYGARLRGQGASLVVAP
jgi:hypothetical protein